MTDLELVSRVEKGDPEARVEAVRALMRDGSAYKTDRALAERIVTVAEQERSAERPPGDWSELSLSYKLGELIARIDLAKTGLWPRVRTLMTTHEQIGLRLGITRYILVWNREPEVFDQLKALVDDPHTDIRAQALDALQLDLEFPPDQFDGLFRLFVDRLADPEPEIALRALQNLGAWVNMRPDLFDVYLTHLESLIQRGEVVPYRCIYGTARLLDADSAATSEQLTRALAAAVAIARNTNNGHDRGHVLRSIGERGGDEGRKLLDELKKDPDVVDEARSVLKNLPKVARHRSRPA